MPAPHPMSTTTASRLIGAIACGFPTPAKDAVTVDGSCISSFWSYPSLLAAYSGPRWK